MVSHCLPFFRPRGASSGAEGSGGEAGRVRAPPPLRARSAARGTSRCFISRARPDPFFLFPAVPRHETSSLVAASLAGVSTAACAHRSRTRRGGPQGPGRRAPRVRPRLCGVRARAVSAASVRASGRGAECGGRRGAGCAGHVAGRALPQPPAGGRRPGVQGLFLGPARVVGYLLRAGTGGQAPAQPSWNPDGSWTRERARTCLLNDSKGTRRVL